jgi:hypothetical protein
MATTTHGRYHPRSLPPTAATTHNRCQRPTTTTRTTWRGHVSKLTLTTPHNDGGVSDNPATTRQDANGRQRQSAQTMTSVVWAVSMFFIINFLFFTNKSYVFLRTTTPPALRRWSDDEWCQNTSASTCSQGDDVISHIIQIFTVKIAVETGFDRSFWGNRTE